MTTLTSPPVTDNNIRRQSSPVWLLANALFMALVFMLLLQAAMHKQLNHDEHMYVSSGILLLHGQWPYIDYPYFQMPLLTLLYGVAFSIWPDYLLVARLINVLCDFGACLLIFTFISKLISQLSPTSRFLLAASAVLLYISAPQFIYTTGLAWNHDLPVLLTVAALFLLLPQTLLSPTPHALTTQQQPRLSERSSTPFSDEEPAGTPLFSGPASFPTLLSGIFIGLATSARLLFLFVAIPFALFLLFAPASALLRVRLRSTLTLYAGFLLGLLPCLPFLLTSPSSFIFGNITYHNLNEQYWLTLNYDRAMTLPTKLSYSLDVLLAEPANWLLLLAAIFALLLAFRFRSQSVLFYILLPISIAPALFIGALVPTPTWLQYFYAPYAFLVITFAICTSLLARKGHARLIFPLAALTTLFSLAFAIPQYLALGNLLTFDNWTPTTTYQVSREIRAHLTTGTVVTLSPIYPLQAGLSIYPTLAAGPFGYRVANTLPLSTRQPGNLLSAEDTLALMNTSPPEAILTGAEGLLEAPLTQFATDHLYTPITLSNGLTLWQRPTP